MWLVFAFGSALFAGLTSILAKCGIKKTDSDVATGIRTIIVLLFSWLMVFIVGSQNQISAIDGKTLLFLILSGLATGASWLCYFKALQIGDINKVVPIDKSSNTCSHNFRRKHYIGKRCGHCFNCCRYISYDREKEKYKL